MMLDKETFCPRFLFLPSKCLPSSETAWYLYAKVAMKQTALPFLAISDDNNDRPAQRRLIIHCRRCRNQQSEGTSRRCDVGKRRFLNASWTNKQNRVLLRRASPSSRTIVSREETGRYIARRRGMTRTRCDEGRGVIMTSRQHDMT